MEKIRLYVIVSATLFQLGSAYPYFRDRIPNGWAVNHPCDPSQTWDGVGHEKEGGGGVRNPFGLDFNANDKTWTYDLCMSDSDGDNKTNGMELGDPDCTWSPGEQPTTTPAPSHPGICEPIDSTKCMAKNSFLECGDVGGFNCPAIKETGVFGYLVGIASGTPVPNKETTYMCQGLNLPNNTDYHLIAAEPDIDNINVAHHIIIYGCNNEVSLTPEQTATPFECFMGNAEGCEDILALWSIGFGGTCYHEDAGIKVGKSGYRQIIFEIHWNNPEFRSDYTDGSGMTLYLTPNLRTNDAGVFMIGQNVLQIPPMEQRVTANGHCSGECTSQLMSGSITVFGVTNHMHGLGVAALSTVTKPGMGTYELARDDVFDYNSPKYYELDNTIQVNPGDSLHLTCHYNSMDKTVTTVSGLQTSDEMCYTFLFYYPKANLNAQRSCTASGDFDSCDLSKDGKPSGCRKEFVDISSPEFQDLLGRLLQNCLPGICLKECIPVAREVHANPCFQGAYRLIGIYLGVVKSTSDTLRAAIMEFYYRADSCLMELAQLEGKCMDGDDGHTSAAHGLSRMPVWVSVISIIYMLLG